MMSDLFIKKSLTFHHENKMKILLQVIDFLDIENMILSSCIEILKVILRFYNCHARTLSLLWHKEK